MTSDQKLGAFLFYVGLFFVFLAIKSDDYVSTILAVIISVSNIFAGVFLMSAEEKEEAN